MDAAPTRDERTERATNPIRIADAAALLGVSDDTLRRWSDAGRIATTRDPGGHAAVDGADLAVLAGAIAAESPLGRLVPSAERSSARNRVPGLVTRVQRDGVMAQVDVQAGPFRFVSLMSREAADDLALEPGVVAVVEMKATTVVVERL